MQFRPCIDIHNGRVKQIVGASLKDNENSALENFVSQKDASFFAKLYKKEGLAGGHIILLNPPGSDYYEETRRQAFSALREYPGGIQVGGGINPENAEAFLEAGASHVIVTSYVFKDGVIRYDRLEKMCNTVGKNKLVLDLSCRKTPSGYMAATDRWQKTTSQRVDAGLLDRLKDYCDEFLVHAVDVEGKSGGIEEELACLLGEWEGCPVTYAGGVHSYDDIILLKKLGKGRLNVTVGSALDLFGGPLEWRKVKSLCASV